MADAGIISITDPMFNFYQNGYYWGVRVEFYYNGNKYRWYEVFENGSRSDKVYSVVNDKESANGFVWINAVDLISGLDSFSGWN